jgi:hypothetical protein
MIGRRYVEIARVDDDEDAVEIGADGVWLDCTLTSTGEPVRARWSMRLTPGATPAGVWTPPPNPGDEVVIVLDGGDPRSGLCIGILPSSDSQEGAGDWKLPAAIVSEPYAVHVIGTARVLISAGSDAVSTAARDWTTTATRDATLEGATVKLGTSATKGVARKFDSVSVGGIYDSAWTAWVAAMTLAGLPTPPLGIGGAIIGGSLTVKAKD